MKNRERLVEQIALRTLNTTTLESRGHDAEDFHDLAVWSIKDALEQAYEAGRRSLSGMTTPCPKCGSDVEVHRICQPPAAKHSP